jgi:hypothetical protein
MYDVSLLCIMYEEIRLSRILNMYRPNKHEQIVSPFPSLLGLRGVVTIVIDHKYTRIPDPVF